MYICINIGPSRAHVLPIVIPSRNRRLPLDEWLNFVREQYRSFAFPLMAIDRFYYIVLSILFWYYSMLHIGFRAGLFCLMKRCFEACEMRFLITQRS